MAPPREAIEVVIPVRGSAPWLSLSLSSIASQTLSPTFVTLVDDGLEDSNAIAHFGTKLFGERFHLMSNPSRGISAALNAAIAKSPAAWIARMDADDIAYPERLRKQRDFLVSQPDYVLGCGTQARFINSKGKGLGSSRLPTSWPDIAKRIQSKTSFIHSTLTFRRDALLATPYRSAMDGAEDVDLVLRLSERGTILNFNETLMDYRVHLTQASFHSRPRQTAIQELAFRLAACREKTGQDPLDRSPDLAEKFIQWRMSTAGYVRARTSLTALRYMGMLLSGGDLLGFVQCAWLSLKSLPVTPSSVRIAWSVYQKAGAALLNTQTPFEALNPG